MVAVLALRGVHAFMGVPNDAPSLVLCDNKGAVQLSDNNTSSKRMKHIATRIAFLRDAVREKQVQLQHIGTHGMVADLFTKPLSAINFHALRQVMMA